MLLLQQVSCYKILTERWSLSTGLAWVFGYTSQRVASLSLARAPKSDREKERKMKIRRKEGGNYLMRYDSVGIIREAQMVMSQMGHHSGAFPRASSSPPFSLEMEIRTRHHHHLFFLFLIRFCFFFFVFLIFQKRKETEKEEEEKLAWLMHI